MARELRCPHCGEPVRDPTHRPFCSARCKDIDLGRWLGEEYRVSRSPEEGEEKAREDASQDANKEGAGGRGR